MQKILTVFIVGTWGLGPFACLGLWPGDVPLKAPPALDVIDEGTTSLGLNWRRNRSHPLRRWPSRRVNYRNTTICRSTIICHVLSHSIMLKIKYFNSYLIHHLSVWSLTTCERSANLKLRHKTRLSEQLISGHSMEFAQNALTHSHWITDSTWYGIDQCTEGKV